MTNLTKRMLCAAWIGFGVFATMTATPEVSFAQGGCGSFCVPGEVINPGRVGSDLGRFRFFVNNEYADLDGYYEGSDTVANPGNASAIVNILTLDVNVLLTERWSIDVLTPWVRKTQNNRRFGQRRADGLGDIAVINNFSLLSPLSQNRVTARFGFKFATGDVEDPGGGSKLPNPFQSGSGAEDVLVGMNYFRSLGRVQVYGNWLSRLPVAENKFDYKFGNEHRIQGGVEIPLGQTSQAGLVALVGVASNSVGHDRTRGSDVPGRLLDGETVLNTGGDWLDFTPGVRVNLPGSWFVQGRVHVPMYENWHGRRSANVGQVRPDTRFHVAFGFDLRPSQSR